MIDMLLVTPKIKEVWQTKKFLAWEKGNLPVVSVKGLIQLKSMRSSHQDKADIEKLENIENEG